MTETGCHCGKDGHALSSVNCPEHGNLTREEAEDLVFDLLQAARDRDNFPMRRSYSADLYTITERVVVALMTTSRSLAVPRPNGETP
jgi:hypothetical protein